MKNISCRLLPIIGALAVVLVLTVPALAHEPDPSICDDYDCDNLPTELCDPGGFLVSLTDYVPADDPTNFTGNAIYTYQVCSPPAGA